MPVLVRHEDVWPRTGPEDVDGLVGGKGAIDEDDGPLAPPCHGLKGEGVHELTRARERGRPLAE
eukprot:13664531-Alexandrium_andersonii.AAC.1